jgi:hypothetical protein
VQSAAIASDIRTQPHDRTALDRLLAKAEADALRRAADFCFWNASGLDPRKGFTISPWTQEQGGKHPGMAYYTAILALIDTPAADPLADPRVQALVEALEWQASQPEAHPFMAERARAALAAFEKEGA